MCATFAHDQIILKKYQIKNLITHGYQSEIYLIVDLVTSIQLVLKYYSLTKIDSVHAKLRIDNEINHQRSLNHDSIIKIIDVEQKPNEVYILMEKASGYHKPEWGSKVPIQYDLFQLLDTYDRANRFLSKKRIFKYFKQLLSAVEYIHNNSLIHGDLKTENILLDGLDKLKIADFDWSRKLKTEINSFDLRDPVNGAGTMVCYPPELLRDTHSDVYQWNRAFYNSATDIWGLGLILYELLTNGHFPWECSPTSINPICSVKDADKNLIWHKLSFEILHKHFRKHVLETPITQYSNFDPHCYDLLTKMLMYDPDTRIDIQAIWQHPFMKNDV